MSAVFRSAFVFAADMLYDMLMLLMALRILRVRIRPLRILFAAFLGALAALACSLCGLSGGQKALLWAPTAALMMRAAAGGASSVRATCRRVCVLFACAGYIGGVVLALAGALGNLTGAHILGGALCAAVFVAALRAHRASGDIRRVRVIFSLGGERLELDAIVDSGNSLRDYLTHRPVIVAGEEALRCLRGKGIPLRPIFADTAGGRQMMRLTMPDQTVICYGKTRTSVEAALAFSPGLGKRAAALLPSSLLEDEEQRD